MWRSIQINKQNIIAETGKAILIACPHNSDFDGFTFWHSSKLVREGKHHGAVSISYTDEFTFNLKKYDNGKRKTRKVVDEAYLNYNELEEIFCVMNENITAPKEKNPYETHKPRPIEAVAATADASLIDDD